MTCYRQDSDFAIQHSISEVLWLDSTEAILMWPIANDCRPAYVSFRFELRRLLLDARPASSDSWLMWRWIYVQSRKLVFRLLGCRRSTKEYAHLARTRQVVSTLVFEEYCRHCATEHLHHVILFLESTLTRWNDLAAAFLSLDQWSGVPVNWAAFDDYQTLSPLLPLTITRPY